MNKKIEQTTMTPIKSTWFHTKGSFSDIGIVAGLNEATGEVKTYIGTASGYNKQTDEKHILETGTEVSSIEITNFVISANLLAQILLDKAQNN